MVLCNTVEDLKKCGHKVGDCSLAQADSMARFARYPLTPEQRFQYAVLREGTLNDGGKSAPVRVKSDQELLAEVIGRTDTVGQSSFMAAYPNIFSLSRFPPQNRV